MMKPTPVSGEFTKYFLDFKDSLIETLFLVCNAVIMARTTNLNIIKDYLPQLLENEKTVTCSHYKRLTRFFGKADPNNKLVECILNMIFRMLSGQIKYLILDATEWKRGNKIYHLLTLCIVYHEVAIPIYWRQLDKNGGHSSQEDRKELLLQACNRYQLAGKILLADREFIGQKWLLFLVEIKIDFIIRMSKTCYKLPISEVPGFVHSKLEKITLKAKKSNKSVYKSFQMNGNTYSVVMVKNDKNDPYEPLVYFISTLESKIDILEGYRIRWRIENCFKHLKTNGFNLEDLNFNQDPKLLLMVAIVVMAYVLSVQQGISQGVKKLKIYKDKSKNLTISFFRQGLSLVKAKIWNLKRFIKWVECILKDDWQGKWLYVQ